MLTEGHFVQSETGLAWQTSERRCTCARCGREFATRSRCKKYCSEECRRLHYKESGKVREWAENGKNRKERKR